MYKETETTHSAGSTLTAKVDQTEFEKLIERFSQLSWDLNNEVTKTTNAVERLRPTKKPSDKIEVGIEISKPEGQIENLNAICSYLFERMYILKQTNEELVKIV